MKVMFALAKRLDDPSGEPWYECVAAVDEVFNAENPDWFASQVERDQGAWGWEPGESARHFVVDVPDEVIRAAFAPTVVDAHVTVVQP